MVRLAIIGGTGDVYLVCALFDAFRAHHGCEAQVIVREQYAAIPAMFDVPYAIDNAACDQGQWDHAFQARYDNDITENRPFYTHPRFQHSRVRVDKLTTKPDASQADMYRMILRLPPEAPMALPRLPALPTVPGKVVIIPRSISWPLEDRGFFTALAGRLASDGWQVVENDERWPLFELFQHCVSAEWVIGPQCGAMSIVVTGRFPCRKTLAVASVDDNQAPDFLSSQTYPYAYVTKFANADYDVEEWKILPGQHAPLIEKIATGANALRLWPHDPRPVTSITMPLSSGDFLDRLAVLEVKYERFGAAGRAAIARELARYQEAKRLARFAPAIDALYAKLCELHAGNFDLLEEAVPMATKNAAISMVNHIAAIQANRERVALKSIIDSLTRAPYSEVKSYYRDDEHAAAAE